MFGLVSRTFQNQTPGSMDFFSSTFLLPLLHAFPGSMDYAISMDPVPQDLLDAWMRVNRFPFSLAFFDLLLVIM